jgi:hypothetical protein
VNVTPIVHFSPAPTLEPQVLLATAKSPFATIVDMVREVARWLVSVTVEGGLVVPTMRLTNVRLTGEIVTGGEPVPVRLTICGLVGALSVNASVPVSAPDAVGENVTPTLHAAPAATLVPQVLLAIAKSPVVAMVVNVRAVFSLLVRVTNLAALVLPSRTVPKGKVLAERVTGATPAPVRLTVCGLVGALSNGQRRRSASSGGRRQGNGYAATLSCTESVRTDGTVAAHGIIARRGPTTDRDARYRQWPRLVVFESSSLRDACYVDLLVAEG